jgi:hypothetical protein
MNGFAAYADLHSGVAVAVAVMRNRFTTATSRPSLRSIN